MKFSEKIIQWYKKNKRDLPWRNTTDPYKIWLSEVILQQTRIDQGLSYYLRFCDNYPNVKLLASASEEQVLKLWQGLGYYSRARNMYKTARIIVDKYHGQFPDNYSDIINLKGIGDYTAAAIISFAYNQVYPVVDSNVMRFLARLNGIKTPINTNKGKKEIYLLTLELIDHKHPGEFNQAIMEFGALQCKPNKPDCEVCIFNSECKALKKNMISDIPVKIKTLKIRKRYFHYFLLTDNNQIYLNKRTSNDIWQNLYDFPLIESNRFIFDKDIAEEFEKQFNISKDQFKVLSISGEYKHILTHQRISARFYVINFHNQSFFHKIKSLNSNQFISVDIGSVNQYPLPRLIDKYLTENHFI